MKAHVLIRQPGVAVHQLEYDVPEDTGPEEWAWSVLHHGVAEKNSETNEVTFYPPSEVVRVILNPSHKRIEIPHTAPKRLVRL